VIEKSSEKNPIKNKRKKIGVVQFPGSNCERETKMALERIGYESIDCFWNRSYEDIQSPDGFIDGFVIVGGFSYEDRVRSGLIASKHSFMNFLKQEAHQGKPILGICNGAQILVESGLLGGPVALCANQRMQNGKLLGTGFYNDWVKIRANQSAADPVIRLPIAHAEGRFLLEESFYQELIQSGTTLYTYQGDNPNGSMHHLAAVSHPLGHIMAMMPHPERTPEGDIILKTFFENNFNQKFKTSPCIEFSNPGLNYKKYSLNPDPSIRHYWVALKIHDNEALSLEQTLSQIENKKIQLKKYVHFEINLENKNLENQNLENQKISEQDYLLLNDELFNPQKEYLTPGPQINSGLSYYFIRSKEDEIALEKQIRLRKLVQKPLSLQREIVWSTQEPLSHEARAILGNPLSHEGFVL